VLAVGEEEACNDLDRATRYAAGAANEEDVGDENKPVEVG